MSLTRSLLNDFRPLFRLIEDPFFSAPAFSRHARPDFWQPFAGLQRQAQVHLTEEGNEFVVRAEMPGVKKEDLDVRLDNDGQSLTIEGQVRRLVSASPNAESQTQVDSENTTKDVVKTDSNSTPDAQSEFRSSFSSSLWLPHPVDGKQASAQLTDGILTLRIPKREQPAPERIAIN